MGHRSHVLFLTLFLFLTQRTKYPDMNYSSREYKAKQTACKLYIQTLRTGSDLFSLAVSNISPSRCLQASWRMRFPVCPQATGIGGVLSLATHSTTNIIYRTAYNSFKAIYVYQSSPTLCGSEFHSLFSRDVKLDHPKFLTDQFPKPLFH